MSALRPALEALMYLAFGAAALPFAWLGVRDLFHYRSHPELLATRDAAPMVMGVLGAWEITKAALALGALLALYFLVVGSRVARLASATLLIGWALLMLVAPGSRAPLASTERLYWDAIPFVVLLLLPIVFAVIRLGASRRSGTAAPRRAAAR